MATRKRGAHRGVVKKRITKLETILGKDGTEETDLIRVRQLKFNLQEKIEILGKLDNEILDGIVSESEMEKNIEEADTFKQTIQTAIDKIDAILTSNSSKGVPPSNTSGGL